MREETKKIHSETKHILSDIDSILLDHSKMAEKLAVDRLFVGEDEYPDGYIDSVDEAVKIHLLDGNDIEDDETLYEYIESTLISDGFETESSIYRGVYVENEDLEEDENCEFDRFMGGATTGDTTYFSWSIGDNSLMTGFTGMPIDKVSRIMMPHDRNVEAFAFMAAKLGLGTEINLEGYSDREKTTLQDWLDEMYWVAGWGEKPWYKSDDSSHRWVGAHKRAARMAIDLFWTTYYREIYREQ